MKRRNNIPFNTPGLAKGVAPLYTHPQTERTPQFLKEGMKHMPVMPLMKLNVQPLKLATTAPPAAQKPAASSAAGKWMSSFKPIYQSSLPDGGKGSSEQDDLYDPYDADPDSEHEALDNRLGRHGHSLPSNRSFHDNNDQGGSYSEPGNRSLNRRDFNPEIRPAEYPSHSLSNRLPERHAYSPHTESHDRPGYGSISRPLDHRSQSPDRVSRCSSTQMLPLSYGGQRTDGEERMSTPEYRREWEEAGAPGGNPRKHGENMQSPPRKDQGKMATTKRLSPPRIQQDCRDQSGYVGKDVTQVSRSVEMNKKSRSLIMEKTPITCDLCDVELTNKQGLEAHLDSKKHWDTLEHIQQQSKYDDVAIAFLQDVMLFKVHHFSQPITESEVQELEHSHHMTRIEMLHCAACKVYVSTAAASVQSHVESEEHVHNKKEFDLKQRQASLQKAQTMMKELKSQFERFAQGVSPFE